MDRDEARAIVDEKLHELRKMSFLELERFIDEHRHEEAVGASGTAYQLETYAFWDAGRRGVGGDLQVIVAIDDGGWSAFAPLSGGFIASPSGEFVGE